MIDPPKDPLAEHPLLEGESGKKRRPATLDLFPDLAARPLDGAKASAKEEDAAPPAPLLAAEEAEVDEPGEEVLESEGDGAVALARRIAAGLADLVVLPVLRAA